jgi:osmoprotectant transport system permease protein
MSQPFVRWDWVVGHLDDIGTHTIEHLRLTGLSMGIGLVLAIALSAFALRWRRSYAPIIGVTGVLFTIPSLAAFAVLVPFTGLTTTTAIVPLVTYTLLILVRNIVTGVDGVPSDIRDAALGMGYRRWRLLWEIELPLALPAIMAGIRIATVTVVGLVTVTSLIGLGGLGSLILQGIRRGSVPFPTPIVVGTIASAALAATLDVGLLGLQRVLTPWLRRSEG